MLLRCFTEEIKFLSLNCHPTVQTGHMIAQQIRACSSTSLTILLYISLPDSTADESMFINLLGHPTVQFLLLLLILKATFSPFYKSKSYNCSLSYLYYTNTGGVINIFCRYRRHIYFTFQNPVHF